MQARQGAAAPAALGARPSTSAAPAAPSAIGGQQAALAAYDALLQTQLKALTGAAEPLGRLVEALTAAVAEAFTATRAVLAAAPHSRKPSDTELQALLRPISDAVSRAGALAGERACPRLHGQAVSEALGAFAWLAYSGPSCGMAAPAQHISETWQAAEFYSNKLLMEFRNKDEAQVLWARGLKVRGVWHDHYDHCCEGMIVYLIVVDFMHPRELDCCCRAAVHLCMTP